MPNNVKTVVKAPPYVIGYLLSDNWEVDFNRVLPLPNLPFTMHYNYTNPNDVPSDTLVYHSTQVPSLDQFKRVKVRSSTSLAMGDIADIISGHVNYQMTGHSSLYDASRNIWGTKWNAYETALNPEGTILTFETAWNHPTSVLLALSHKFPSDIIEVIFADEDVGSNCGHYRLVNGTIRDLDATKLGMEIQPHRVDFATHIWAASDSVQYGLFRHWDDDVYRTQPTMHHPLPHDVTMHQLLRTEAPTSGIDIDDETDFSDLF